MGISFEGRDLSNEEQREILNISEEHLRIVCVIDTDKERKKYSNPRWKLMELSHIQDNS